MSEPIFRVGNRIRVLQVPPSVLEKMPLETITIFRRCVGQILSIEGFDNRGHLELNVMDNGSQAPNSCHHTIWIEPEYVELVS